VADALLELDRLEAAYQRRLYCNKARDMGTVLLTHKDNVATELKII